MEEKEITQEEQETKILPAEKVKEFFQKNRSLNGQKVTENAGPAGEKEESEKNAGYSDEKSLTAGEEESGSSEDENPYDEDEELELLAEEGWNPEDILNEWKESDSGRFTDASNPHYSSDELDPFTKNLQEGFQSFKEELLSGMEEYRRDVGIGPGDYREENQWEDLENLEDLQFDDSLLDETRMIHSEQIREAQKEDQGKTRYLRIEDWKRHRFDSVSEKGAASGDYRNIDADFSKEAGIPEDEIVSETDWTGSESKAPAETAEMYDYEEYPADEENFYDEFTAEPVDVRSGGRHRIKRILIPVIVVAAAVIAFLIWGDLLPVK